MRRQIDMRKKIGPAKEKKVMDEAARAIAYSKYFIRFLGENYPIIFKQCKAYADKRLDFLDQKDKTA